VKKNALLSLGLFIILLLHTLPAQGFESSPIGWASLTDGNMPFTITGGSAGATVTVSDPNSLRNYATSTSPYVILVSGTITMPRGSSSNHTQTILVQSNKTIVGIGSNPGVNGGFDISGKSNVIIRNLNIWYRDSVNQGSDDPWTDGITVESGSQHVWIDHCNVFDSPDGLIDPTKQSNYLTLSWNKFYYTPDGNNTLHRNCCLVGSSDSDTGDRGKLKETFHHNWWYTNCKERMPRVRFGQVHVFNNYYSNLQSGGYCQGVGEESQIKVENNYYDAVPLTWKDYHTKVWGKIGWNMGNVFHNCSIPTTFPNDYNNIFVPPYSYTLDTGASVITNVTAGAGVDKLTPSPNPMTFSVAPYALSNSSISMTAAAATCADGVQYMFTCTAGGGHSSGWQSGASYTDTGLSPNTAYTYTVQTRNATQTLFTGAASSPASATTQSGSPPGAASSPTPVNGATNVSTTQDLSWTAGSGATSHDVYFGTAASPPFIGNQTATIYYPGTMSTSKTYYWRIDEKNTSGTTTGTVWNFTTGLWGCTAPIVSDKDGDCQVDFFDFALLSDSWTGNWLNMLQFADDWLTCNRNPADQCWQ
jgi:pectate lyase